MTLMTIVLAVALACWLPTASRAAAPPLDTAAIESLTGAKGALDAKEGVFKVSLPRADIKATVAGVRMTPPLGLTAWAAFTRTGKHTMVMGDIVLLEDQVNPVLSAALDAGLEVTALHNHFFWDNPKIMFMHVGGMGEEKVLARAVGKVFARLKETAGGKGEILRADVDPAKTTLSPAKIEAVLAHKGELKDGVYRVVVGRTTKMAGHTVGKQMGINTWAAFAGSDDHAVVDGDFAMLEAELQPVLKALRAGHIDIVAIHNHMTGESPRVMFLHYWGVGTTETLAQTIKAALDKTKHLPASP
jgi:hypothetical protein